MDQTTTWYGGRPRLGPHRKKGDSSPQFSTHVYCGQTAGWIKMPFGLEVGLDLRHIVLDGGPPRKEAQQPPPSSAHIYCVETVALLSNC